MGRVMHEREEGKGGYRRKNGLLAKPIWQYRGKGKRNITYFGRLRGGKGKKGGAP